MKAFNSIAAEESEQSQLSEASGCDSAVDSLDELAFLLQFAPSHSFFCIIWPGIVSNPSDNTVAGTSVCTTLSNADPVTNDCDIGQLLEHTDLGTLNSEHRFRILTTEMNPDSFAYPQIHPYG